MRFYALIFAGILLAILVLQNPQKVRVDFLFISSTPLIFALLIAGGLGALIGWAFPHVRRSRRPSALARTTRASAETD